MIEQKGRSALFFAPISKEDSVKGRYLLAIMLLVCSSIFAITTNIIFPINIFTIT